MVCGTGAPEAGHPFLDHPWCASDSDQGIAWGVLTKPSMKNLVGVVRWQRVEEEIGFPRYLIGATGEGAVRLRQDPEKPLPLGQLIFLHSNNDILASLLANHGQDPLDHLLVESRSKNREDRAQTPEPAKGSYPFLNRNVWEEAVGIMQADEDEDEDEDEEEEEEEEEWIKAQSEGEPEAPPDGGVIVLHNISIDT